VPTLLFVLLCPGTDNMSVGAVFASEEIKKDEKMKKSGFICR
jgi:hypothetical protein